MKKFLPIILCLVLVCGLFTACADNDTADETTTTEPTAITTDDAKITQGDAIRLIQSYSNDELGLTEEQRSECSFLVAGEGVEIEGKYYIKVIAAVKQEHVADDGSVTYTFDEKGVYFIGYDGEQVMSKDMTSGEYMDLEVKEVPTTEAPTTHAEEDHTH